MTDHRHALAVALVALLVPASAPAKSYKQAAQVLVREGNLLVRSGACVDAIDKFQKAKELFPASYKIEVNLGTAATCAGQLTKAAGHFEVFLDRAESHADAKMIRAVRARLDKLRDSLASISLRCAVAGGVVVLNGETIGTTPVGRRLYLMPGAAALRVDKLGHYRFVWKRTLAAGQHLEVVVPWSQPRGADEPGMSPPATPPPRAAFVPPPSEPAPARRPVYKRWWFWTLIGAGVAGGVVAGVLATRSGFGDRMPQAEAGRIPLQ